MSGSVKIDVVSRETGDVLVITVMGDWNIYQSNISFRQVKDDINSREQRIVSMVITSDNLTSWDSSLIVLLKQMIEFAEKKSWQVDFDDIPSGIQRIIILSQATNRPPQHSKTTVASLLEMISNAIFLLYGNCKNFAYFVGDVSMGIYSCLVGRIKLRSRELYPLLQDVGIKALPIVTLISFLVGLILAFVSILQLAQFGAAIYVADLVGIVMLREMGCIMTGVIMSGRTGAAFAATIGSMVVNDEVDAIQTIGLSTTNFLVLPRIIALTLMMPFLSMFSAFVGIIGGMCTALVTTNLSIMQYFVQTVNAVTLNDFLEGVCKGGIFGLLIAAIGCFKGLQSGHSAEDVGLATTSAVVTSITAIIIADAFFAILFSAMGI